MAVSKFEEKSAEVLNLLAQGYNFGDTCQKVGINRTTLFRWMEDNATFATEVKRARKEGEQKAIEKVEAALLDLAMGKDWEDVTTEYEARPNPKYDPENPASGEPVIPTIKKQRRVKKHIPPQAEAIKFYLTNKAPELWKNRQQQEIANLDVLNGLTIDFKNIPDGDHLASSEDEVLKRL